jgi:TPR repeat protein
MMKNLLEKLSRYWPLRFVAMGAGVLLIAYAVLLPDSGDESFSGSIESVAAAPLVQTSPAASARPNQPQGAGLSDVGLPFGESSNPVQFSSDRRGSKQFSTWQMADQAVADELDVPVRATEDSDLPRDFGESIRRLQTAASRGNTAAEFLLGHAYETGAGVRKDIDATTQWYARAAAGASAGATGKAAGDRDRQPENDFTHAFETYRAAAERGDTGAQLYLGLAYDLGLDVSRNPAEAAHWYRLAHAGGSTSAASNLGVLYHNGDGMVKDTVAAAKWFQESASRGSASAQYSLGRLYFQGDGVEQDYALAAKWLEQSASQGNASAQILLSYLYATGHGVKGNTPLAYMWINLASAHENLARLARTRIEKVASTDEINAGQRLTHDWLTHHPQSI